MKADPRKFGDALNLICHARKVEQGRRNVMIDNDNLELWDSSSGTWVRRDCRSSPKSKFFLFESWIDCLARKQHRISFIKSNHSHRRKACVRLVYIDVCSMTEKSLGGLLYFVIFINDHLRKVWMFLLKSKDQVLNVFKEFHARLKEKLAIS